MTDTVKRRAAFLLGSLAFTWLFFAEYLSPFRLVHIPYDLEGYHYPLVDYAFQNLKQGRFPQWDWSIYSGTSFVGNLQTALFYPPTWLLFLANASRDHVSYQSLQTFVLAHVWLGAVLCFCWLRGRGLGNFASIAGAQVFAFSGYVCLQLQHQGLVTAFAWFPLAAWGIDDASERQSWWPLWKLILASALCFLTGYPPMWIVFAVSMMAYALGKLQSRLAVGTLLALFGSLLLAMIQILPALEAARFMQTEASYGAGIREPRFFLSYLLPNYFNFGLDTPVMTNPGMEYLYLGAPGLAGLALLIWLKRTRAALPALLALVANAILLTNAFGLVWAAIQHSELLAGLIRSWYFLAGLAFAAVCLAADGIDAFLKRPYAKSSSKALPVCASAALLAWSGWELWQWFHQGFPFGWESTWITMVTLVLFAAGLFCLRGAQGREALVLFAALIFFSGVDYKVFGTSKRFNAGTGSGSNFHADFFPNMDKQAYREIHTQPEYRVLMDQTAPSVTIVRHWGVTTPQGFDPLITKQYRAMLGDAAKFRTDREFDINPADDATLRLLGVRYLISAEQGQFYSAVTGNPKFRRIGSSDPYYKVFEYLDAMPPFGIETGHLQLRTWNPEHRIFQVQSADGARLHLSEQLIPGWTVTIDGTRGELERWHGAFQSVVVPAGEHTVEFRFSSSGVRYGAWISLVSLAGLVWMARRCGAG